MNDIHLLGPAMVAVWGALVYCWRAGGICVLGVVVMMLRLGHVISSIISKVYNIVVLCSYAGMQVSGYQDVIMITISLLMIILDTIYIVSNYHIHIYTTSLHYTTLNSRIPRPLVSTV